MRNSLKLLFLACLAVAVAACDARVARSDGGGVLLTFGVIDWPASYSTSAAVVAGSASIDTVTLVSVAKDPDGVTSSLMDVELQSFEVTFGRADQGTRVPPTLVRTFPGVIPVNGSLTISGLVFMLANQLENPPLSDLLAINGGFDKETGGDTVVLNVSIRFFGKTLSGDEVESAPLRKTVQFTR